MTPRNLTADPRFKRALARLGSANAAALVRRVARRLALHPHRATTVLAGGIHMLRMRSYPAYPALRLFYTYDAHTVYLLDVQRYDELVEGEGA